MGQKLELEVRADDASGSRSNGSLLPSHWDGRDHEWFRVFCRACSDIEWANFQNGLSDTGLSHAYLAQEFQKLYERWRDDYTDKDMRRFARKVMNGSSGMSGVSNIRFVYAVILAAVIFFILRHN